MPEWLGLPTGAVVLLVVMMALGMFLGGEYLEQLIGKKPMRAAPKWRLQGAGVLLVAAISVFLIGQPTHADRWANIEEQMEQKLAAREVQITSEELLNTIWDEKLQTVLLDVRSEVDFNLFHLRDAGHVPERVRIEPAAGNRAVAG